MFKIGEFSKLSQVSIRMLRHYNDIDLLVPEKIDEFTGYRYYLASQLITINQIQELKSMGISLATIKEILKNCKDKNSLQNHLTIRKAEIEDAMEEMKKQISLIESSIKRLEEKSIMKYNVNIKEIPSRKIASIRKVISNYSEEGMLWGILNKEIASQNPKFANLPYNLAIYHDEEYKECNPDVEIQTTVIGDYKDTENVIFKDMPEIMVASVMIEGPYEQIAQVNATVANWIIDNGYEFNGTMFSIYHVGPGNTQNTQEWVTEICYPIKSK